MGATSSPIDPATRDQLVAAIDGVLQLMLDRYERDPAYGLIDMKLDILSGEDFADDDPIRGKNAVYGWIQGRALESLAGHAAWVKGTSTFSAPTGTLGTSASHGGKRECPLYDRIVRVTRKLIDRTEQLRKDAGGRLRFLMTPQGQALTVADDGRPRPIANDGPSHYTDLFYAKGLAAAAKLVADEARLAEAQQTYARVLTDIVEGRFVSDQEQLDPRNSVRFKPGHVPHGPWMIAIGAASVFHPWHADAHGRGAHATDLIEHVLDHYTNDDGDMWELNDPAGQPLVIDGVLRNDPGHATEFAGLSLKFRRIADQPRGELHDRLCRVLVRNFDLGFAPSGIGIVKAVNLLTRQSTNTDMPWWSLPETIRAAVEAWSLTNDDTYATIARRCSDAFVKYYLRPDRWFTANQTVDQAGHAVARIPATPDADPGYHTGLSLIDALGLMRQR